MRYRVSHTSRFDYNLPVSSAQQLLRLKPRNINARQSLLQHHVKLSTPGAEVFEHTDYFGNALHEVRLHVTHEAMSITSECEVDVYTRDEILLELSPPWESVADALRTPANEELWQASQFCFASPHVSPSAAREFALSHSVPGISVLRLALNLTQLIYRDFTYQGGVTDVYTDVSEVLARRMGVCQDFAHVAIATLRTLGLAARYVSGYILSQTEDRPALVGSEASHAWISVYCPEFGWVDFDPTNNQMTSDQHITLGWGRDYADIAPTRGSIMGGGQQSLDVDVRVRIA